MIKKKVMIKIYIWGVIIFLELLFLGYIFLIGNSRSVSRCSDAVCPSTCEPGKMCSCVYTDENGKEFKEQCRIKES